MPTKQISITIDESALAAVDARCRDEAAGVKGEPNRSGIISRDLGRYYAALEAARKSLAEKFSEAELSAIMDACNGTIFDESSVRFIWAEVADAIRLEALDKKWSVESIALPEKIRALDTISTYALAEAIEKFWKRVGAGEQSLKPMEVLRG